jgi:outer membrane murein-binding lipoprotein Lpp
MPQPQRLQDLWRLLLFMLFLTATWTAATAMDSNDPRTHEWYALMMAGAATVAAAIWKGIFAFRRDIRNDMLGGAHTSIVDELRSEVQRLSATVSELSVKLDVESERRRAVENENHELKLRIQHLEHVLEGREP